MEQFLVTAVVLAIGIIWLDNYLYSKSGFSLRNFLNINLYLDEWQKYGRAASSFKKYPSQKKIDVMIKYGLYEKGTTRLPDLISGPLGDYESLWRIHFDSKNKAKDGSCMCHEIIRLYRS